jgi:glyoxylase-like metal-dependent hydrolase (beta-lactamase superfamily II)
MHAKVETEIKYLFDAPPEPGTTRELLPGLTWVRVPLPFVLNHVNCWLLDDATADGSHADSMTLIDTGADKPETRELWDQLLLSLPPAKKITRLIGTHGHPDHIGLAGWFVDKLAIPLHMTLAEWLAPQVWREEGMNGMRPSTRAFYLSHGLSEGATLAMDKAREQAPFRNYPLPANFVRLRDGETTAFGGRTWQILVNGGHADEHASFHCEKDGILIAGDQILSRITPVVGVFPSQPLSDPLADYLKSLVRLRKLPADTIVLPSHGLPFRGLHTRIDQLAGHHKARLDALWDLMGKPAHGIELAHGLFPKAMAAKGQTVMALAETLAHAHHLITTKRAKRLVGTDGGVTFVRV